MRRLAHVLACSMVSVGLYANTNGLPIGYTGAPTDNGGQTCIHCHTGTSLNPVFQGLAVSASAYQPGVPQTIKVTLKDNQQKFGFQLTARLQSDVSQQAGTFNVSTTTQVYCAPNATPAPCGKAIEFVTNTVAATQPESPGTRSYSINWTPPARDLGPVILYVAAVAANSDGTATGDHVFALSVRVDRADCNLPGPPSIAGVTDAASGRNRIASSELISIFGFNLGSSSAPGYQASALDLDDNEWPRDLACIAVEVSQRAVKTRVPVYYVGPLQINAQAPVITAGDTVDVTVILNPDAPGQIVSPPFHVAAGTLAPAFFTFGPQGTGNVAALNASKGYAILANTSVVPAGVAAAPGDVIELYGTGFGDTDPHYDPGEFASLQKDLPRLTNPITVTIGNVTVPQGDIYYAGLAFAAPGLYQINVRVPDVPDGDQLIYVKVGGSAASQGNATIPVKH